VTSDKRQVASQKLANINKMKKIIFLFGIIILNLIQSTFGQNDCKTKLVIGEWKFTKSIYWGEHTNVDSLRFISPGDTASPAITIQFYNDNTYKISLQNKKKQQEGYYIIDNEKCEIILNRNKKSLNYKKSRERSNWEIIYIDKEILIYKEDNNPKNYATHVLLKK
jgi:hypothetical protein